MNEAEEALNKLEDSDKLVVQQLATTDTGLAIIRQNALGHADEFMKTKPKDDGRSWIANYFEFAQECEEWVLRKR